MEKNQSQYSWIGVLEFLQDQYRQISQQQTEWLLEKQEFTEKITSLEAQLQAQENINKDLIRRIKMLEFSLKQERLNYTQSSNQNKNQNFVQQMLLENPDNPIINNSNITINQLLQQPQIPKRKAKSQRPLLMKFLEEVGFGEIFSSLNELQLEESCSSRNPTNINKSPWKNQQFIDQQNLDNQKENQQPQNSKERNSLLESQVNLQREVWIQNICLKSHLDSIRNMLFLDKSPIFVTISEDCMVKLWNVLEFENNNENEQINPYITLREHTGPLFSLCGNNSLGANSMNNIIFTAGSEGLIKLWNLPYPEEIDQYGPSDNRINGTITWIAHEDSIWDMKHHPYDNNLLSSSSDGLIKLWDTNIQNQLKDKPIQIYSSNKIPSCLSWISTNLNQFCCGFIETNNIAIFDRESSQIINYLKPNQNNGDIQNQAQQQTNQIISHQSMNLVISAQEDSCINYYDLYQNKMIKSIKAHEDSITSISLHQNNFTLASVSHDGYLKTWDIRKYECITENTNLHLKKYDETINCVCFDPIGQYLATGGTDGFVNILQIFNNVQ